MNNEIIVNRNIEDLGLRTEMSLKQKFRPYSVLVVLRTSASLGFNDQVRIPALENLTSGEFLCGSLSKDVLDCRRIFVISVF